MSKISLREGLELIQKECNSIVTCTPYCKFWGDKGCKVNCLPNRLDESMDDIVSIVEKLKEENNEQI